MKAKLLKKIRNRFNWYIGTKGIPVLIDNKFRNVTIIDFSYLVKKYKYQSEEDALKDLTVTKEEWAWRCLKDSMYKAFGYTLHNQWYNIATRRANKNKNRTLINEKD